MKKKIFTKAVILVAGTIITVAGLNVKSNVKATSYIYDFWKNIIPSTEGITYKETYYNKDITYLNDQTKSLPTFTNLVDMEVYNSKIFVIDQCNSIKQPVYFAPSVSTSNPEGLVNIAGISKLYVIDENFHCESEVNEFLITDEVKAKLDSFYHFDTPLDQITEAQFSSSEFIDVYDVIAENAQVNGNKVVLAEIAYDENIAQTRGTSLQIINNGKEISDSQYTFSKLGSVTYLIAQNNYDVDAQTASEELQSKGISVIEVIEETEGLKIKATNNYEIAEEISSDDLQDYSLTNPAIVGGCEYKVTIDVFKTDDTGELVSPKQIVNTIELTVDKYNIDRVNHVITIPAATIEALGEGYFAAKVDITADVPATEVTLVVENGKQEAAIKALQSLDKTVNYTSNEATYVTFTGGVSDGDEVQAIYKFIDTVGRAPYSPYSLDHSKAAVRLSYASGVTANDDFIFIADTSNARILKLNYDFEVVDVYLTPEDNEFYQITYDASKYETPYGYAYETIKASTAMYNHISKGQVFQPKKLAISLSGVVYCIAANIYEGLIEFGADTTFNRYLGKNVVTQNALKKLWQNIWSEAQYASQAKDLPSMFNNLAVSEDGFLYATSDPDSEAVTPTNLVQIINTKGNDIMKRNGYVKPDGDAVFLASSTEDGVIIGSSTLTAVGVSKTGNFTVADSKRGRLFTYDSEGNLLYITGEQPGGTSSSAIGGLSNSILNPVAVDYLYRTNSQGEEEETVIVLDQLSNCIILYETTEFGNAVNTATYLYQNGVITDTYATDADGNFVLDENGEKILISQGAESYWRQVVKMNTNYELAYLGIGKALNRRGEYKEAMYYFKLAHSAPYYSKAFSSYRDQVLTSNFNLIMTVVLVAVAAIVVNKVVKSINEKNAKMKKEDEE